jgi:hemerythrin-like domain-containing protein
MNAIEILKHEHRAIEQVIDSLVGFSSQVEADRSDERAELGNFVRFIREFADRCHHGKEEDILFTEMIAQGFPRQNGPLAVMYLEHERGRQYVRALDKLARQATAWSAEEREQLIEAAAGYAELLRNHIRKEDGILYPLAESQLAPESWPQIEQAFERFEQTTMGPGAHQQLHELADQLSARWAAAAPEAASDRDGDELMCCG